MPRARPLRRGLSAALAGSMIAGVSGFLAIASGFMTVGHVFAADFDGVWTTDKAMCDKVFVKTPSGVAFAPNADLHGSGFIIAGTLIRGRTASCKISKTTTDGNATTLFAHCATDVMISDTSFRITMQGHDRMTRSFPSMPEMNLDYYRCEFGQ